jgi:hypothetical protein
MFLAARETREDQCGDSWIFPEAIGSNRYVCHWNDSTQITDTKQADVRELCGGEIGTHAFVEDGLSLEATISCSAAT